MRQEGLFRPSCSLTLLACDSITGSSGAANRPPSVNLDPVQEVCCGSARTELRSPAIVVGLFVIAMFVWTGRILW